MTPDDATEMGKHNMQRMCFLVNISILEMRDIEKFTASHVMKYVPERDLQSKNRD